MKFTLYIIALIVLGYIAHQFLPWWSIVVLAGIVGSLIKQSGIKAFSLGFFGVTLLWGLMAAYTNFLNNSILAERIGELFGGVSPTVLILMTALLGGFVGGMGAVSGYLGRQIFIKN